jgi:hypothetical protein
MSNCEGPRNVGNSYSADFVLAAGTLAVAKNDARMVNFNSCSKIMGIVRKTAGGVFTAAVFPRVVIGAVNAVADTAPPITLFGSVNTDTSTYTLFWQNEVSASSVGTLNVC